MDLYCPGCGYFASSDAFERWASCPGCQKPIKAIRLDPIQEELDKAAKEAVRIGLSMDVGEAKRSLINAIRGLTNGKE